MTPGSYSSEMFKRAREVMKMKDGDLERQQPTHHESVDPFDVGANLMERRSR